MSPSMTKPTKWPVRPAKIPISLGIPQVYAVRMKIHCILSYPLSTQRRLIRLGRCSGWSESYLGACHFVGFVMLRLIYQACYFWQLEYYSILDAEGSFSHRIWTRILIHVYKRMYSATLFIFFNSIIVLHLILECKNNNIKWLNVW